MLRALQRRCQETAAATAATARRAFDQAQRACHCRRAGAGPALQGCVSQELQVSRQNMASNSKTRGAAQGASVRGCCLAPSRRRANLDRAHLQRQQRAKETLAREAPPEQDSDSDTEQWARVKAAAAARPRGAWLGMGSAGELRRGLPGPARALPDCGGAPSLGAAVAGGQQAALLSAVREAVSQAATEMRCALRPRSVLSAVAARQMAAA